MEKILRNDRKVKELTITAYKSHFKKLAEMMGKKYVSAKQVYNHRTVLLSQINEMSHSKKVGLMTAMLIAFSPREKCRPIRGYQKSYDIVNALLKKTNKDYAIAKSKQEKTGTEQENWVAWTKIVQYANQYEKTTVAQIKLQDGPLNNWDFNELQRAVILALYTKLPPRRYDYAGMKVVSAELYKKMKVLKQERKQNLLVIKSKTQMFFSYGTESNKAKLPDDETCVVVRVPRDLARLLTFWRQYNQTDYLLINIKIEPLTKNGLGKQLKLIFQKKFDKNIGVVLLRKIFLSFTFSDDTTYKLKMDIGRAMNHSVSTQQIHYVKK